MSTDPTQGDDRGQALLARISNEMVRAQKEFFGKGPTQAKSYILDDLLIIVMRGGLTTAEKTMLDFGKPDQVRQFRQLFENEMTGRLTDMVEQLTGREVAAYQSQIMFDPDVIVEMFVFDRPGEEDARTATAEGQLRDDGTGEATDEGALDEPSSRGKS
jgi:uncharacterized protein YbcI